jgi:hypothetical protein
LSVSNVVKAILEADTSLNAILTGGIYDFEETDRRGITFQNTPAAFNGPLINPCAIIHARRELPLSSIKDEAAQVTAVSQAIEIWIYQEAGYDAIELAMQRIYTLLQDKNFTGLGRMQYAGTRGEGQAEEINGVSSNKIDFQLIGVKYP